MMPIHVIANGGLFKETFNAIVTVVGTSTFSTAIRLSALFAILSSALYYIKSRDVLMMGKWFVLYFAVMNILLVPKVSIEIIDSSNPGATYQVDHVPFGLAYPASLITSIGHALSKAFDEAFSLPNDLTYSRTGMLFGSRLYKLSTGFHFVDKNAQADFYQYEKNCVMGDIQINHLYTWNDVMNSHNLWQLITQNPSPIRGIITHDGKFYTCKDAVPLLKTELDNDVQDNGLKLFGLRIFGGKSSLNAAAKLAMYLPMSYQYFSNNSQSAVDILKQNVLINALKSGVLHYAAETGAAAAITNASATRAMENTRLAWSNNRAMAPYTLAIMQSDLLLLMLGMFPLIVLLAMQPMFGMKIFKNYLYSLIWIESWPALFSVLNLCVTFYLQHKTSGLAHQGLTLSNSQPLALEHSDMANMAGYLMTCVPFIAIGIVKGMASAFSQAAYYIGGMMHSMASGAAVESASGNFSAGNMNYNNVHANKFDTNRTHMAGMNTRQLADGALVTETEAGTTVYNTSGAISSIGTSLHMRSSLESGFSQHASEMVQAANHERQSADQSISSFLNKATQFNQSQSRGESVGQGFSHSATSSVDQAASSVSKVVSDFANKENISQSDALRYITQASLNEKIGFSSNKNLLGKLAAWGTGVSGSVSASGQQEHVSVNADTYEKSAAASFNHDQLKSFAENLQTLNNYAETNHLDASSSQNMSLGQQMAADLRSAVSHSDSYSTDMQQAGTYNEAASFVRNNSAFSDTNLTQEFVRYVEGADPTRAEGILTGTSNSMMDLRGSYAQSFLRQKESALQAQFDNSALQRGVSNVANHGEAHLSGMSLPSQSYANNAQHLQSQYGERTKFDAAHAQQLRESVEANKGHIQDGVSGQSDYLKQQGGAIQDKAQDNIKTGQYNADKGVLHSLVTREKDLK